MATETTKRFFAYGANRDAWLNRDPELVLAGPAGTGKSRALLERLHYLADKYPGMRAAIIRKTRKSLTQSALATFTTHVLHPLDRVRWHTTDQEYRYPNGSRILVMGMDDSQKVMSADLDMAYVQEATELNLNDWEVLTTRLRNDMMPFQQVAGDCNPQAPTHWLKLRCNRGQATMLESRHEDNPALYDGQEWTRLGRGYIAVLDNLTGVRRKRLRLGQWVAAEGQVYDRWDRAVHLIDPFPIPRDWRRLRSIDFGYTNPFVCQWWAIDPDGRMYLYREIYMTQRLVSDHAEAIKRYSSGERIEATVTDHDAEDRATLEAAGITTAAANKAVSPGIQATADRLQVAGDGAPRLMIMRDALVERDGLLATLSRPYATEHEPESYVWPEGIDGKSLKEAPVKLDDHGMDAMRYAVMFVDDAALPYQYLINDPAFRADVLGDGAGRDTEEQRIARRVRDYMAAQGVQDEPYR